MEYPSKTMDIIHKIITNIVYYIYLLQMCLQRLFGVVGDYIEILAPTILILLFIILRWTSL